MRQQGSHQASFVPAGFELGAHLRRNREVLQTYGPQMRDEMGAEMAAGEAWPPPPGSLRGCMHGSQRCSGCGRGFSPLWVHRGVCCECEAARRRQGCCPFRPTCGSATFCAHAGRCLACEDYSCELEGCQLVRGDGESVALLASRLPNLRLLLLDFDRTLASTRNGCAAAPPQPRTGDE
eukprot:5512336-Prymnesium_polylepis.1